MKKLLSKIWSGISMGCFAFTAMLFIASLFAGGADIFIGQLTGNELLKSAACTIIISLGFYVPTLVYELERFSAEIKVLIHMTAGTIALLLISFIAGWVELTAGNVVLYIVIALASAALCWLVIWLILKSNVRAINKKIKAKQYSNPEK